MGNGAKEAEVAQGTGEGKEVKGTGKLVFNLYPLVFLPFDKQIKLNFIILRYFKSFLESFLCRFTFRRVGWSLSFKVTVIEFCFYTSFNKYALIVTLIFQFIANKHRENF